LGAADLEFAVGMNVNPSSEIRRSSLKRGVIMEPHCGLFKENPQPGLKFLFPAPFRQKKEALICFY
jgi:hypothetical protein